MRLARLNAFLQERLERDAGGAALRPRGGHRPRRFAALNRDHLEAHLRSITIYAVFFPAVEVLTAVAMALLLWYGGLRVLDGTLTVGVLAAFIQYTRRFFQPLQDLSREVQPAAERDGLVRAGLRAAGRAGDGARAGRAPSRCHGRCGARSASRASGSGTRPTGPGCCGTSSFTASPGQTIALVGHTGAGKTTIVSLLLRFYDPERGRITVDGVDIRQLSTADLRSIIGFVQQDLFLFTGDILHNLTLDAPIHAEAATRGGGAGGRRPLHRAAAVGVSVIELGERGRSLSVGERQLLSFARALALDPSILVLDEATSSVDAEAEAQIQRAIAELMAGRTSLVVAHRLSTILHADEILVMHHGEIRERGSHRELLAAGGPLRAALPAPAAGPGGDRRRLPNPKFACAVTGLGVRLSATSFYLRIRSMMQLEIGGATVPVRRR